jgi:hypothetical protein
MRLALLLSPNVGGSIELVLFKVKTSFVFEGVSFSFGTPNLPIVGHLTETSRQLGEIPTWGKHMDLIPLPAT